MFRNLLNSFKSGASSLLNRLGSTFSSAASSAGKFINNLLPAKPLQGVDSMDGQWTTKGFRREVHNATFDTPQEFAKKYSAENKMVNNDFGSLQPQVYKEKKNVGNGRGGKRRFLL